MDLRSHMRSRMPDYIANLRVLARDHGAELTARSGYSIQNAAGAEAVVRIYDEIWWLGVNAQDFVRDLDTITAPSMRVEINSPGGDVFDGIAIYNALRNHPAFVTTRVDGIAASIASVIAQAGDRRIMQPASQMMIHNAWGMTVGDTRDHADMAALLEQQDAVIAGIYAARSGKPADEFRALMNAETWLTAEAALDAGLADEIVDPPAKTQNAQGKTLHAQISEAMDVVQEVLNSAETVAAVRAAAGKDLSNRNAEGLVGLRDAVTQLTTLIDGHAVETTAPVPTEVLELQARLAARLKARPALTGE